MVTKNFKYIIIYIDMLGFVNRAIIDKKNTGFSEDDLRLFYQCKIEKKIERLLEKKVIINSEKKYSDSWQLISSFVDSWATLKIIREMLETSFEFEIFVDIVELSKSEEEKINLSNDMMTYLKTRFPSAVTFLNTYKEWYNEIHTDSPKKTFILLTVDAYEEFDYKSICAKPYLSAEYYLVDYYEFENLTALSQKPFLTQRTFILNNDYISIPTETDRSYDIIVPSGNTFLNGDFRAFGGKENSILVRIFDKKTNNIYYNSALVTNGHIGKILPTGNYIIIFSNKYDKGMGSHKDMSYDKIVAATIYLENVIPLVPQISMVQPSTPSWIVFERWLKNPDGKSWGYNVELWVIRSDGYGLKQLTNGFYDTGPEWSPNGLRISFSRIGKDTEGIFIVDSNGKDIQRLSSNIRAYNRNGSEKIWFYLLHRAVLKVSLKIVGSCMRYH